MNLNDNMAEIHGARVERRAQAKVVSIYGQVLLSKQLNKYTDQFVVPLTGFSPGIYIVSIRVRDQVLDNCRLIVVK